MTSPPLAALGTSPRWGGKGQRCFTSSFLRLPIRVSENSLIGKTGLRPASSCLWQRRNRKYLAGERAGVPNLLSRRPFGSSGYLAGLMICLSDAHGY